MEAIKATEIQISSGPGQRLREAREALKLSPDQVAHHLRLERKLILDIEADRYENFPRFTFIRGYLRSYAKLVDLPADELVQAFDGLSLQEKPTHRIEEPYVVKEFSILKNQSMVQWIPYLLLAIVLLLGTLVYQTLGYGDLFTQLKALLHIF